jgi:ankyrin repeat protein
MARTRDNATTPLHEVATGEVAEVLIQGKADVNAVDEWDMSPLHYAAQQGRCDVARCLIEYHAAVSSIGTHTRERAFSSCALAARWASFNRDKRTTDGAQQCFATLPLCHSRLPV